MWHPSEDQSCSIDINRYQNTYGYIWSDWLYHHDKDQFMVDVYNDCKRIDECLHNTEKAALLSLLRDKVQHSNKPWVEGIIDFINFETAAISSGKVPLDILADSDDYKVLAIIDGGYRHGAFRGLCRTASGAEWIGLMGEWCAATLHQGLKGIRLKKPVSDWELPILGEAWCKGMAKWSLVCLFILIDQVGDSPDNDIIISRIHTVIAAHHMAGVCWLEYRGGHPHRWFSSSIRGVAPSQQAIRRFGEKHNYPTIMIDVLCRAADHVNQWINPHFNPIHFARTRGLLIGDHTPRLKARVDKVCDELKNVTGDMTASEEEEFKWRASNWMTAFSTNWSGRGNSKDTLQEITLIGALTGVLRESRPHVTPELVDRVIDWSKQQIHSLSHEQQETVLSLVRTTMEIRGRIPGAVKGNGSAGLGHTRFIDGVWELAVLITNLANPSGAKEFPPNIKQITMQYFNSWNATGRVEGVDFPYGDDVSRSGCPICLHRDLFIALVDNRPTTATFQGSIWGILLYSNLGLGLPDDMSLGCVKHE